MSALGANKYYYYYYDTLMCLLENRRAYNNERYNRDKSKVYYLHYINVYCDYSKESAKRDILLW